MEQRVSLITLGVRDLDQSRAFYERLGWRRSALNAEEVAFFQVGGLVLSLFPREHLAEDAGLSPEGSGFCGIALAYNTRSKDEVKEVLREAERAGARILKPAQDVFWAATLATSLTRMATRGRWRGIQGLPSNRTGAFAYPGSL